MAIALGIGGLLFLVTVIGAPWLTPIRRARFEVVFTVIVVSLLLGAIAGGMSLLEPEIGAFAFLVFQGVIAVLMARLVMNYRRLHTHLAAVLGSEAGGGVAPLVSWLMRLDAGRRPSRGYARLLVLRAAEALIEAERFDDTCEVLDAVHLRDPSRYQGARGRVLQTLAELGRGDVGAAAVALRPAHNATHIAVSSSVTNLRALLAAIARDCDEAERLLATVPAHSPISAAGTLARAHCLAARDQEDAAAEVLRGLPPVLRRMALVLAQSSPGPASALAARLEVPESPYR